MEKQVIIRQEQQTTEQEMLVALYDQINDANGMVREMTVPRGYLAAVGDVEDFRQALGLERDDDTTEITYEMFNTLPALLLFAYPGIGDTRVAAVENAQKAWQDGKESVATERLLHGSFAIAGGRMSAYMPATDLQQRQWTIEYVKDGAVIFVEYVKMDYSPIFGPDTADVGQLNQRIEELIAEHGLE